MKKPMAWALIVICLVAGMASCDDWFDDDDVGSFNGDVIADRLDTPWEMAFAPNGRRSSPKVHNWNDDIDERSS